MSSLRNGAATRTAVPSHSTVLHRRGHGSAPAVVKLAGVWWGCSAQDSRLCISTRS